MSKTTLFVTAVFLGALVGSAADLASAAAPKKENAEKRAECLRESALYIGQLKGWWMKQCMAGNGRTPGKPAAVEPTVHPPGAAATPRITPLGRTTSGSTAPSNAPVAPSSPTVGSSGTSISGSGATSTSGSSNTSIGSSGSSSGGGR